MKGTRGDPATYGREELYMKAKRRLTIFLVTLIVLLAYGTAQGANLTKTLKAVYRNISIIIDGKAHIAAEEPFIVDGHVYVPLRFISEALQAKVDWDNANSRVLITTVAKSDPSKEQAKWQEGYNAGLAQGQLLGNKTAQDKGYKEGYDEGYKKGKDDGYDTGYKEGSKGSKSSKDDFRDGEDDGYDVGWSDGRKAARSANSDKKKNLGWKDALDIYADITYRTCEDDIIYKYEKDYGLNTRRYPDYTDGFIDGYLDGFQDAFDEYYDY